MIRGRFDVDEILERLDEHAADDQWCSCDDALFEVPGKNREAARQSLADALSAWADQYVVPQYFTARNPETVIREQIASVAN